MNDLSQLAADYEQAKADQQTAQAALDDATARFGPAKDALIAGFVAEFGPGPFDGGAGGTPTPPPAGQTARSGQTPGQGGRPGQPRGDVRR